MVDRVGDWVAVVDSLHPERHAEPWDSVGLQVGDPAAEVREVVVTLDVTLEVLAEGEHRSLVVAHHPVLFRPLERLTPATAAGRLALEAASRGIAVLAAHTNLDIEVGGTNDACVELLSLEDVAPLQPRPRRRRKLVTFVPPEATDAVLTALSTAGAGVIGEYDQCSFRSAGTGSFRPSADANPTIGEHGRRNDVAEERLEVVLEASASHDTVAALVSAHPYEEVAYDLYDLVDEPGNTGIGRIGNLPRPRRLGQLAGLLAAGLPSPHLRLVGDPERRIARVAVVGGAGTSLAAEARRAGADVLVTGDVKHHDALDAATVGLALIDAGHHPTERPAMQTLADRLDAQARRRGLAAPVRLAATSTYPWSRWEP